MTITDAVHAAVLKVPASAWTPAVEPDGEIRDGAWVAELDGDCLKGWPKGMRLIVRKERPHPGAQLRFTDADGMRLTCFATNTRKAPIAELELRYRQRARAEDRIRAARATGLRNLPLHDATQNQIWLEIVQIALDLLAWMPLLALTGQARLWEPRRLRLRLFSAAAQLVTTGRRRVPPSRQTLALDQRDHRCPATAHGPSRTLANQQLPVPTSSTTPPEPAPTRRDNRATSLPTRRKSPPPTSRKGPSAS
jgi:hypothetical protein